MCWAAGVAWQGGQQSEPGCADILLTRGSAAGAGRGRREDTPLAAGGSLPIASAPASKQHQTHKQNKTSGQRQRFVRAAHPAAPSGFKGRHLACKDQQDAPAYMWQPAYPAWLGHKLQAEHAGMSITRVQAGALMLTALGCDMRRPKLALGRRTESTGLGSCRAPLPPRAAPSAPSAACPSGAEIEPSRTQPRGPGHGPARASRAPVCTPATGPSCRRLSQGGSPGK